jgi:hypothetical protein
VDEDFAVDEALAIDLAAVLGASPLSLFPSRSLLSFFLPSQGGRGERERERELLSFLSLLEGRQQQGKKAGERRETLPTSDLESALEERGSEQECARPSSMRSSRAASPTLTRPRTPTCSRSRP